MSEEELYRRALRDGYRDFARSDVFVVYPLDRSARTKMLRKASLRIRSNREDVGKVPSLTQYELEAVVQAAERRRRQRSDGVLEEHAATHYACVPGASLGSDCREPGGAQDNDAGRDDGGFQSDPNVADAGATSTGSRDPNGRKRNSTGRAKALLRHVWAAAAALDGSNEPRIQHRREAYALCNHFGLPHIFITISPNDFGSATLWYKSGALSDGVFSSFDLDSMIPKSRRLRVVAKDSPTAVRYFNKALSVFLEHLLGCSIKAGEPHARGGVFGHCKALYGGIEAQALGTAHPHLLVWRFGHTQSLRDFQRLLKARETFSKQRWTCASEAVRTSCLPNVR